MNSTLNLHWRTSFWCQRPSPRPSTNCPRQFVASPNSYRSVVLPFGPARIHACGLRNSPLLWMGGWRETAPRSAIAESHAQRPGRAPGHSSRACAWAFVMSMRLGVRHEHAPGHSSRACAWEFVLAPRCIVGVGTHGRTHAPRARLRMRLHRQDEATRAEIACLPVSASTLKRTGQGVASTAGPSGTGTSLPPPALP